MSEKIYLKLGTNFSKEKIIYVRVERENFFDEDGQLRDLEQEIKVFIIRPSGQGFQRYLWHMSINHFDLSVNLAKKDLLLPDELLGMGLGSYLLNYAINNVKQFPNYAVARLTWAYVDAKHDSEDPIEKEKFVRREKFYSNFGIRFELINGGKYPITHRSLPMKCADLKVLDNEYFLNRGVEEIHDPENFMVQGETIQKFFGD